MWSTTIPSFHHMRRHMRISVPFFCICIFNFFQLRFWFSTFVLFCAICIWRLFSYWIFIATFIRLNSLMGSLAVIITPTIWFVIISTCRCCCSRFTNIFFLRFFIYLFRWTTGWPWCFTYIQNLIPSMYLFGCIDLSGHSLSFELN